MIKYKAVTWNSIPISQVEIERETDKTVWYKSSSGRLIQDRKIIDSIGYFDTWEEAKEFLLREADIKVQRARRDLEIYNAQYGNVKGLKQWIKEEK